MKIDWSPAGQTGITCYVLRVAYYVTRNTGKWTPVQSFFSKIAGGRNLLDLDGVDAHATRLYGGDTDAVGTGFEPYLDIKFAPVRAVACRVREEEFLFLAVEVELHRAAFGVRSVAAVADG